MLATLACLVFIIAALLAFGTISGIAVIGMIAVGLALLAAHHIWGPSLPWHRA